MEKPKVKISSRGGARPGAGRKPGSKDNVTIKHLLEVLEQKSGGQRYEELLVDDFLTARLNNDTQLMLKYHNLLGNKLFATLNSVEVVESEDAVDAKQKAFQEALAKLASLNESTK
jgi:hypothetical protein